MRTHLKILFLLLMGFSAKSQAPAPSGFPAPYSAAYYRIGWLYTDSGYIAAPRDTNWVPKYQGTEIIWLHAGVDTAKWIRIGNKWVKELKTGDVTPAIWGNITGTLSNQTDLQNALNTKIGLTSLSAASPIVYNNSTGQFSCPSCGTGGGGITSLNALTATTQTFATGTSGTDFGISSSGSVHTFNIPTGSASNRGLISTADWSTFNGKQDQINGTGFVKATGTTISFDNTVYYPNSNPSSFISRTGISALSPILYNNSTGVISGDTTTGGTHFATQAYVLNHQTSGTITGAGNLSPLFTTSIVSNTIIFTLSNAVANSILGNNTGSTGPTAYFVPTSTTLNGWFGGTIQGALTLTTTGTSGASTLIGNTLNIPQYSGAQNLQQVLTVGTTLTGTNTIVNTGQILNLTGGQFRFNGLLNAPGTPTFLMHGNDSTTYQLPAAQVALLFPTQNIFVKRGLSGSNDSTFVLGNAARFDSAVYLNGGNLFKFEIDSMIAVAGRGFRVNFGSDAGWDLHTRDSATGFWTRIAKGIPGNSLQMLSTGGIGWASQIVVKDTTILVVPTNGNTTYTNSALIGKQIVGVWLQGSMIYPAQTSGNYFYATFNSGTGVITLGNGATFATGDNLAITYVVGNFNSSGSGGSGGGTADSVQVYTSGATVTVTNGVNILYIDPGSSIVNLTINPPIIPSATNNLEIYFGGTVAAGSPLITGTLTISGTIYQLSTPSTILSGDNPLIYKWRPTTSSWYRKQ